MFLFNAESAGFLGIQLGVGVTGKHGQVQVLPNWDCSAEEVSVFVSEMFNVHSHLSLKPPSWNASAHAAHLAHNQNQSELFKGISKLILTPSMLPLLVGFLQNLKLGFFSV